MPDTEALAEMLPCPFCGGEATSYMITSCDCCGSRSGVAYCAKCGAEIGHEETEAKAIALWNTRDYIAIPRLSLGDQKGVG